MAQQNERRELVRQNLATNMIERYPVIEFPTAPLIGKGLDLSPKGIRILTTELHQPGKVYRRVCLHFPFRFFTREQLIFDMVCCWVGYHREHRSFEAGYEIREPSKFNRLLIERLLQLSADQRAGLARFFKMDCRLELNHLKGFC